MSFRKYRFIDLLIFTIIFMLLEFLISTASIVWFPETIFSVSIMLPLLLLLIMRWDYYATPLLFIFGAFFVLTTARPGTASLYAIYLLGNLALIIPMIIIKKIGKEKISEKWYMSCLYVIVSYVLLELFRGIGAMIFASYNISVILEYLLTDSLNLVFALIVIIICRLNPGLFVDQKSYLLELEKERQIKDNF